MHKTMTKSLISLLALHTLAACSPLPRQAEALAGSQACCREISQFQFQVLEFGDSVKASISEASPAYAFGQGKSYFAAFRLPAASAGRKMLLKTHRTGFLVPDSQIFCPVITFLDDKLQPVITTSDLPLSFQPPPDWVTSGFWYSVVQIPDSAAHAVVHTPAAAIGRPVTLTGTSSGYTYFTGSSYVYVPGSPSTERFPCGQTGRIEVKVR